MKTTTTRWVPLILLTIGLNAHAQGASTSTVDVVGQSPTGNTVAEDGATIIRTKNGITASLKMPTPVPGEYEYPAGNGFQPLVFMGAPEVFTGWIFIFNYPAQCSDGICDLNDLGPTPAMGGAYNFGGHIVGGSTLNIAGNISVGEPTFAGAPLSNPAGAEVHLAIAPHGTLQPDMLPDQITKPIGGPDQWWLAIFVP